MFQAGIPDKISNKTGLIFAETYSDQFLGKDISDVDEHFSP